MSTHRHQFQTSQEEQDYFDGLIRVDRKKYNPHHVSIRLHRSLARKRLNVGGLGSSKTRTMCEHINNMLLMYPGGRGVLARKDLGDLKKTAQTEFLETVVSPETIDRFNINDNTLYYKNGSKLFFMETKTPSNFKSLEIIVYGIEEADENEEGEGKDRLMTMLDGRLRQKIFVGGQEVLVPYAGIWTYNPTTDDHWLAKLEDRPDAETEVFRSTTYDNKDNLPEDYIPSLLASLAPWEIQSLIYGRRASRPKGKPVIHGFTIEANVRPIQIFHHLPILRGWDFGFNHPCSLVAQYDPEFKRAIFSREIVGDHEQLKFFAPKVLATTKAFAGPLYSTKDYCDPHGADQRDVGESSVEHLRLHHGVHCLYKRKTIKKGLDEIQEMVLSKADYRPPDYTEGPLTQESRFLVDPSCKLFIAALMGGYYRGPDGKPVKDDLHDHPMDVARYIIDNTMNAGLAYHKRTNRYVPRCAQTGY